MSTYGDKSYQDVVGHRILLGETVINTGNAQLDALVVELQAHIQLFSERAAMSAGENASLKAENTALQAKIKELTPKAPE